MYPSSWKNCCWYSIDQFNHMLIKFFCKDERMLNYNQKRKNVEFNVNQNKLLTQNTISIKLATLGPS